MMGGANAASQDEVKASASKSKRDPQGKPVEVKPLNVGEAPCAETGGVQVQVKEEPSTAKGVCNGKKGTFDFSIPLEAGEEETGVWVFNDLDLADGEIRLPVSLTVHLNRPRETESTQRVWFEGEANFSDHCGGNRAEPEVKKAAEMCIYTEPAFGFKNAAFGGARQPGTSAFGTQGLSWLGGYLIFTPTADDAFGSGTWAVRGCDVTAVEGEDEFCPEF